MKVGIDLMGGDQPPYMILNAIEHLSQDPQIPYSFVAIAHPEVIQSADHSFKIDFVQAPEYITMDEPPLKSVRRKKNSSMAIGLRLLKTGAIDAFVSTGNTGALIASAMLNLSLIEGIDRPALMALLPSKTSSMSVLDVGANLSPKANQIVQFALMGVAYQQCIQEKILPKVGLLNIGIEKEKGTEEIKKAYSLLLEYSKKTTHLNQPFHFVGNIEGSSAFHSQIDVLVAEGFAGNVFLKTSEGIASFMLSELAKMSNLFQPALIDTMHKKFNYAEYPGGLLCGLDGIVIKCHGNSNLPALINGIKGALHLLQNNLMKKYKQRLLSLLIPNPRNNIINSLG